MNHIRYEATISPVFKISDQSHSAASLTEVLLGLPFLSTMPGLIPRGHLACTVRLPFPIKLKLVVLPMVFASFLGQVLEAKLFEVLCVLVGYGMVKFIISFTRKRS